MTAVGTAIHGMTTHGNAAFGMATRGVMTVGILIIVTTTHGVATTSEVLMSHTITLSSRPAV
eukprot:4014180-Pyramimonas_sp.AAC.1